MRIVHIGPCALPLRHTRGGAIERRILELGAAQAALGHVVTAYSAQDEISAAHFRGIRLKNIACQQSGILKRFEFLGRAIDEIGEADILHFHSVPEGAVAAATIRAAKVLSYDYFLWRGARHPAGYWLCRTALRRFEILLPVSDFCRSESLRYWCLPANAARVLNNGVNLEQFRPDQQAGRRMRAQLGTGADPVILYVGRVCEQKGTDLLLAAYRELRSRIPRLRLVVAGPPDRFAQPNGNLLTEQIAREGGIYLGAVEEYQLAALYNSCDVFVMPTREDEMFGMAALEAQACGKPVVCSRHGGLVESVSEKSGRFFPCGDAGALATQLEHLLRSDKTLEQHSLAARAHAEQFGWLRVAEQLDEIYSGLRVVSPSRGNIPRSAESLAT